MSEYDIRVSKQTLIPQNIRNTLDDFPRDACRLRQPYPQLVFPRQNSYISYESLCMQKYNTNFHCSLFQEEDTMGQVFTRVPGGSKIAT